MIAALMAVAYLVGEPEQIHAARSVNLETVQDTMSVPNVDVHFVWMQCGEENAFYDYRQRVVIMCYELVSEPEGAIRFIAAHEMAHAIVYQLDLPVVGNPEESADELAAIMMAVAGHDDDVLSGAIWFKTHARAHNRFEEHPPSEWRAEGLVCVVDGLDPHGVSPGCRERTVHAAKSWLRIIKAAENEIAARED